MVKPLAEMPSGSCLQHGNLSLAPKVNRYHKSYITSSLQIPEHCWSKCNIDILVPCNNALAWYFTYMITHLHEDIK